MHYQLFNTTVKICSFCSISHGEICSQNEWKPCLNYCGICNTDTVSRIYQQNICSVEDKELILPIDDSELPQELPEHENLDFVDPD